MMSESDIYTDLMDFILPTYDFYGWLEDLSLWSILVIWA